MHVAALGRNSIRPEQDPLPRSPVLGWSSFSVVDSPGVSSVEELPHRTFTTSGRAAIFHALRLARLEPRSVVLVPSYHCPTMVAPVLLAGLRVKYFAIQADGLPNIGSLEDCATMLPKAIIVPHYFGFAQSLADVRAWCDARQVVLIEDCAHCFFGDAGDRPVGCWGDFATASLSKFFPVPEAGLLASCRRPLPALALHSPSLKAQVKGWADGIETAAAHHRLRGLNTVLRLLFKTKNRMRTRPPITSDSDIEQIVWSADRLLEECDMGRICNSPLLASMVLKSVLPRGRIVKERQRNFSIYAESFANVDGARSALASASTVKAAAPYVFPLWVDDAEQVYQEARARALPVFRWDRLWPGVPTIPNDVGPLWSQHVLQLLCHQDLSVDDIHRTADSLRRVLNSTRGQRMNRSHQAA